VKEGPGSVLHGINPEPLMSAFGSEADITRRLINVRFTPKIGHLLGVVSIREHIR
jgi:hypothetical protein